MIMIIEADKLWIEAMQDCRDGRMIWIRRESWGSQSRYVVFYLEGTSDDMARLWLWWHGMDVIDVYRRQY